MPTDSGRPHGIDRCKACGTAVWSEYGGLAKLRFVRAGTLDEPSALTPDVHIYVRSKLPWVALPEGMPAFEAVLQREDAVACGEPRAPSGSAGVMSARRVTAPAVAANERSGLGQSRCSPARRRW